MLFQPTSITPDQLGGLGNGIVRSDTPLVVSWLVNGNSAMVAFKIDYYSKYRETDGWLSVLWHGCTGEPAVFHLYRQCHKPIIKKRVEDGHNTVVEC